jgi:hypothetical protein
MPLTLSSAAAQSRYVCDALQEGDEIRSIDGLRMDLFLTNCQIKVSYTISKRVCLFCLFRAIFVYRKHVAAACDTPLKSWDATKIAAEVQNLLLGCAGSLVPRCRARARAAQPLTMHQVTLSVARAGKQIGHVCAIRDFYY